MIKPHFISVLLGTVLMSTVAHAQSDQASKDLSYGGWGTGVVTGVLGIKKFNDAGKVRAANTHDLIAGMETARLVDQNDIKKATNPIENGDEIRVKYHYNEAKNKAIWIEQTESSISSLESSATYHEVQSYTATKAVYVTESDGKGGTTSRYAGQEPDYFARMQHASQAASARAEASALKSELSLVRNGVKPAPLVDFEKKFVEKYEAQSVVKNFLTEEAADGSKIYHVSRLPREARLAVRSANIKGGVLITIAVFSTAMGTWEYFTGDVSKYLDTKGFKFSDL